ncbi:hypothetical protein TrVFT333_008855 [Trichoderma virens FT-333]|nr:hypothetical protein TrVFT333_008855 [Trichoderma virens FT-333]
MASTWTWAQASHKVPTPLLNARQGRCREIYINIIIYKIYKKIIKYLYKILN